MLLISSAFASVANVKGMVVNGTTRRPCAGDEIVLLSLSHEGMNETARSIIDSHGRFMLPVADQQVTHIVRVTHQGVIYHKLVQTDSTPLLINVYDVAQRLDGIHAVMDVQRFEATSDQLEVKQLITMRNESKPPRTLMKDRAFEIQLPPEAKVEYGLVQVEEQQPLKQKPIAGDRPGEYYFVFPMRPGDTRFAVVYRVPYKGEATVQPTLRNRNERFVVMVPNSMKFEPADATVFQPMPGASLDNVQGTAPLDHDKSASFRISGTGTLTELQGRQRSATESGTTSMPRPGGGLGAPIGLPDPLEEYRWRILSVLAVMMLVGGAVVVARGRRPPLAAKQRPAERRVPVRRFLGWTTERQ
jgi:hypothetical protein